MHPLQHSLQRPLSCVLLCGRPVYRCCVEYVLCLLKPLEFLRACLCSHQETCGQLRVQGLKWLPLPRKEHSGECAVLVSVLQCPCGHPSLSSTPHLPSRWPCCPNHSGFFPEKQAHGTRRLPAAFPVPPGPSLPLPAEPSHLPGSASVGNFPGHLYS